MSLGDFCQQVQKLMYISILGLIVILVFNKNRTSTDAPKFVNTSSFYDWPFCSFSLIAYMASLDSDLLFCLSLKIDVSYYY